MDATTLQTFTSPVVLFFVLGVFAAFVRSDLAIPEAIAKGMSLYLMAAIGLKGGVAVAKSGIDGTVIAALMAGIAAGFILPFFAYAVLKTFGRLDRINSGAVAAHYGSISVVTFVTAVEILTGQAREPGGFMVAVMAAMEAPAILSGLMLARGLGSSGNSGQSTGEMLHEVFTNSSIMLLLGAFVIGLIGGVDGFADVSPFFEAGFKGVLCIFLLDMGLIAARRMMDSRAITWRLGLIAILLPLINGAVGTGLGVAIGLDAGSAAALGVLCASASYIAVPAAMRLALPEADPGIYLTMSLSITFPFNVLVNIGLISAFAAYLTGGGGIMP
ncbi:sodium-dependent bicarbonate transport family permease [Altererythrobacter sp.]|uniref:sodium-dependent bicarbonate transport family permease n=1 Tax=Altererythrobacter sp. TaxID=1872480 RepID=UPI001B23286E|nr:sodium-dependent bicarbonate transport family permease [Altererythrobacter sp.]MBO6608310.1 sodium-dependent bicarbonate transport family permease [Altererythrobacter sp.]MBO6641434.1 sodium-dependent bicarbonate transport family permease [Altererythrobacter sp.]MBO6707867.1 sodium-dependent bicarbonate transport family permease [Altererythrobacter sp.]